MNLSEMHFKKCVECGKRIWPWQMHMKASLCDYIHFKCWMQGRTKPETIGAEINTLNKAYAI